MIAIVPIADGELLSREFLTGIASQTVPISLAVFSGPACHDQNYRETNINLNRARALEALRSISDEFVLLIDSDVILNDSGVVSGMVEALKNNAILDYCVVDTKGKPDHQHLTASLCLIRVESWKSVDYRGPFCQCSIFTRSLCGEYVVGDAYEFPEGRKQTH